MQFLSKADLNDHSRLFPPAHSLKTLACAVSVCEVSPDPLEHWLSYMLIILMGQCIVVGGLWGPKIPAMNISWSTVLRSPASKSPGEQVRHAEPQAMQTHRHTDTHILNHPDSAVLKYLSSLLQSKLSDNSKIIYYHFLLPLSPQSQKLEMYCSYLHQSQPSFALPL